MRRNNLDITADILEVANQGAKKTQIVYKTNLNFLIVKKYLNNLMEKNLMNKEDVHYYTTEKGREFLNSYREFASMVESVE